MGHRFCKTLKWLLNVKNRSQSFHIVDLNLYLATNINSRPRKSQYNVSKDLFPVHFASRSVIHSLNFKPKNRRFDSIWVGLKDRLASDNQSFNHHMMSCKNDRSVELDHFDMVYYRLDRARPVSLLPPRSLKNFLIKLNLIIWSLAKLLETMVSTFYIFPGL